MTQTIVECTDCSNKCSCYYNHLNYRLEQLAQKMQENEELKDKIKKLRKNLALEIEASDRYRKALEEIEEEITALHYITIPFHRGITHELADIVQEYKNKILDIINKAKGEGMEIT